MSEEMYKWISWHQATNDYRPVSWPPPPEVLGYWCSGQTAKAFTLVAIVKASSPAQAKKIVTEVWSPGVGEWRFCETRTIADGPPGDRFPPPDWAVKDGRWPW